MFRQDADQKTTRPAAICNQHQSDDGWDAPWFPGRHAVQSPEVQALGCSKVTRSICACVWCGLIVGLQSQKPVNDDPSMQRTPTAVKNGTVCPRICTMLRYMLRVARTPCRIHAKPTLSGFRVQFATADTSRCSVFEASLDT